MSKILENHKEKRAWMIFGFGFVLVAGFLRFFMLDNKPIHFDESINMWFVQRIWEDGFFRYDPTNYHGPMLFYLIQFVQLFTGPDFISTRVVASIFSFLTLLALWWGPREERTALRFASLFLLLSPGMGFYGRSGIHESAFVFFQVLSFLSFHFLVRQDYRKFWWTFAAGFLGMMALKETFVILILAGLPAAVVVLFLARKKISFQKSRSELWRSFKSSQVLVPLLLMVLLFVGFYTGFGSNPQGIADFFIALMPWLKTGVHGNGHEKEFLHWTKFMLNNEILTVAGFLLGLYFVRKNRWILFYAAFAFFNWLIYSLIPYKTPWCLISILWPFAIVAGFGVSEAIVQFPKKAWFQRQKIVFIAFTSLLGIFLLFRQSEVFYALQYRDPIAMDHPYVYVNSTYQMKDFIKGVRELAEKEPLLRERPIQIATEESWPLPIVLLPFYTLNYQKTAVEVASNAIIYFVDQKDQATLEAGLQAQGQKDNYERFHLSVRQGREDILVYMQKEFLAKRAVWDLQNKGGQ